jgi:acid phosphatase
MTGPPQFGPSALTPDGYAVNTLAPPYWPTWIRDPENPDYSKPDLPNVLVPQTHEHIGDKLSKKNIDWAWYAGAWQATLEQFKDSAAFPRSPTSSTTISRSTTSSSRARKPYRARQAPARWRPGRRGRHQQVLRRRPGGKLPAVTFYKPQGNLNMHAVMPT